MRTVRHNIKIALPGKGGDVAVILDYSGVAYSVEDVHRLATMIEQGLTPGIYGISVVTQILEDGEDYDKEQNAHL